MEDFYILQTKQSMINKKEKRKKNNTFEFILNNNFPKISNNNLAFEKIFFFFLFRPLLETVEKIDPELSTAKKQKQQQSSTRISSSSPSSSTAKKINPKDSGLFDILKVLNDLSYNSQEFEKSTMKACQFESFPQDMGNTNQQ